MKKYCFILIGIAIISAGCDGTSSKTPEEAPSAQVLEKKAVQQVDYIEIEATLLSPSDLAKLGDKFVKPEGEKTFIRLSLSNHRDNLENFDYRSMATLDRQPAESWQMLSSTMGGHHVKGVLTFDKNPAPQTLLLEGLPAGEARLSFSPSEK